MLTPQRSTEDWSRGSRSSSLRYFHENFLKTENFVYYFVPTEVSRRLFSELLLLGFLRCRLLHGLRLTEAGLRGRLLYIAEVMSVLTKFFKLLSILVFLCELWFPEIFDVSGTGFHGKLMWPRNLRPLYTLWPPLFSRNFLLSLQISYFASFSRDFRSFLWNFHVFMNDVLKAGFDRSLPLCLTFWLVESKFSKWPTVLIGWGRNPFGKLSSDWSRERIFLARQARRFERIGGGKFEFSATFLQFPRLVDLKLKVFWTLLAWNWFVHVLSSFCNSFESILTKISSNLGPRSERSLLSSTQLNRVSCNFVKTNLFAFS